MWDLRVAKRLIPIFIGILRLDLPKIPACEAGTTTLNHHWRPETTLGEALCLELRPFGVDVLAAAPGPVISGFGDRANMRMDMALKPSDIGVPILKALGRKTTVLPGLLTKLLVGALRTLPR